MAVMYSYGEYEIPAASTSFSNAVPNAPPSRRHGNPITSFAPGSGLSQQVMPQARRSNNIRTSASSRRHNNPTTSFAPGYGHLRQVLPKTSRSNNVPLPAPSGQRNSPTTYFVPGYGLSHYVMFDQIHYYLGSDCTIEKCIFERREGYLITQTAEALTKSQLDDLAELSRQYEEGETAKMVKECCQMTGKGSFINQPIRLPQQSTQMVSVDGLSRRKP